MNMWVPFPISWLFIINVIFSELADFEWLWGLHFLSSFFIHKVRAVVSHGSLSSYIVRSSALVGDFDICNNQPHVIQLVFTSASLQLTVDSNPSDLTLFDAGTPTINVAGRGLYIGGIPDTTTVPLISGVATQSFQGCIQDLVINGVTENLRNNIGSSGFITGCPRPF